MATSTPVRIVLAALALLVGLGALPAEAARAGAAPLPEDADPGLTVLLRPGPGQPHEIPLRTDPPSYPQNRSVVVQLSAAQQTTGVRVSATPDAGLLVDDEPAPRERAVGTVNRGTRLVRLRVAATVGGLHRLRVSVSADGMPERAQELLLWAPGGAPLPGGDSLAGVVLGANGRGIETYQIESELSYRFSSRLHVVDDRFARRDTAPTGRCFLRTPGCLRYRYDASTGLLQVGEGSVDRVRPRSAYLDDRVHRRLRFPRAGVRLAGTWRYRLRVDDARGVGDQRLVLGRDGTYALTATVANIDPLYRFRIASAGRYRILERGRLQLTDRRGTVRTARLAVQAAPGDRGIRARGDLTLDLRVQPPRRRAFWDGNLLTRLR